MPSFAPGYDAREHARHSDALQTRVTQEQAVEAIADLCRLKGLPPVPVVFHTRRGRGSGASSWYQSGVPGKISIARSMLNALVAVHEWAHYAHRQQYLAKKKIDINQPRQRWHGPEHQALVDEGVAHLKKAGLITVKVKPLKTPPPPRPRGTSGLAEIVGRVMGTTDPALLEKAGRRNVIRVVAEAFLKSLPETMECPRCHETKARDAFGTRVLKKDAHGLPVVMGRQSFCKVCRRK